MSFNEFFEIFRNTRLWKAMETTYENSPWHREANVAIHTQMLIDWYAKHYADKRNKHQQLISLTGSLFHDTGKPVAETVKESKERGVYRTYKGHEQISARLWVDYALTNYDLVQKLLGFSLLDISNIAMMIEYHVPFSLKDKTKRFNLKKAFIKRIGLEGHQAWLDMMLCDQNGRISDNQAEKLAAVDEWMIEWEEI